MIASPAEIDRFYDGNLFNGQFNRLNRFRWCRFFGHWRRIQQSQHQLILNVRRRFTGGDHRRLRCLWTADKETAIEHPVDLAV